jgi:hypothetical protein
MDLHSVQDSVHQIVLNVYLLQVQSYLLQKKALIISRKTQHNFQLRVSAQFMPTSGPNMRPENRVMFDG